MKRGRGREQRCIKLCIETSELLLWRKHGRDREVHTHSVGRRSNMHTTGVVTKIS